jgi:hypothetical protein
MHFDPCEKHQEENTQIGYGGEDFIVSQPRENWKSSRVTVYQHPEEDAGDELANQRGLSQPNGNFPKKPGNCQQYEKYIENFHNRTPYKTGIPNPSHQGFRFQCSGFR